MFWLIAFSLSCRLIKPNMFSMGSQSGERGSGQNCTTHMPFSTPITSTEFWLGSPPWSNTFSSGEQFCLKIAGK